MNVHNINIYNTINLFVFIGHQLRGGTNKEGISFGGEIMETNQTHPNCCHHANNIHSFLYSAINIKKLNDKII